MDPPSWTVPILRGAALSRADSSGPAPRVLRQMTEGFRWQDGERVVRFGRGAVDDAPALLDAPYALLTTERAAAAAPAVAAGAERVVHVGPGRVDELAGELLEQVGDAPLLAAVGGGRVIDVAKSIAAAT